MINLSLITKEEIPFPTLASFHRLQAFYERDNKHMHHELLNILDDCYKLFMEQRINKLEITKCDALSRYYELHGKKHVCFADMVEPEAVAGRHVGVVELAELYQKWDDDLLASVNTIVQTGYKVEQEYQDETCGKCYILTKEDKQ